MFLGSGVVPIYATPVAVQLPAITFNNTGDVDLGDSIVYSGVRFGSDGNIYKMTKGGAWQGTGKSWLLDGAASGYYLVRTVNTGTLNVDNDGTLQQMNADLDYSISENASWGESQATITFEIADDAGGTNVLATRQYTLRAVLEGTGVPP